MQTTINDYLGVHIYARRGSGMIFQDTMTSFNTRMTVAAIITESALSFPGLDFPSGLPTSGRVLFDSTDDLQQYPERGIWPGLAISLAVPSVNDIGDGLRIALNPRISGR